jgi:outer membrane protein OmpA-like peptidoglycan-associated protein
VRVVARVVVPLAVALLAGCSSVPDAMDPANWWHSLEGGQIADERPPPPNADAPYPSLGSVPARPVVTDAAARGRIAAGLVADRANAQYAGAAGPDPSLPASAPQAFGRGTAPPPAPAASADNPSATLQAATAPPPPPAQPPLPSGPPTPPRPAPIGKVAQEPLRSPPVVPAVDAAAVAIPAAPPTAPHIAGVDVPAVTVPTPPPVAPPVVPVVAATATPAPVLVSFQPGLSEIAPEAQDALRTLAQHRGTAPLEAVGYGDAAAGDPAAASAALPLALARARAIAAVLMASGVPSALVHVDAEAEGHGGAARVAN